jgi:uncharacterized protein (DUF1684 family)
MDIYQQELLEWRHSLDENLRKKNSWLALAGLFWLEEGENSFGTDPDNRIVFPAQSGPEQMGTLLVENGQVTLKIAEGVDIRVDGKSASKAILAPDITGLPSEVSLGSLVFTLIQREESLAIRLWDNSRKLRNSFPGREWFPIQDLYRIAGTYQKYAGDQPLILQRKNAAAYETNPAGVVNFVFDGRDCSLVAYEESEGELFTLFHDLSNGKETYSSGRYLVVDPPQEGTVTLDFNRAFNPPCAFTPYATCPLPPSENRLQISLLAGEKSPPGNQISQ